MSVKRQDLLQRLSSLESQRPDPYWREIDRYLYPGPSRFDAEHGHGRRPEHGDWHKIMDNTGTMALTTLQSGFMAGATSPARAWCRAQVGGDPDINLYQPVREWLDDLSARALRVARKSNTYRALRHIYGELGSYSTAATVISEDFDNVIHHLTVPVGQFYIAQDWRMRVNTFYRKFSMTGQQLVAKFGAENCSRRVRDKNSTHREFAVVHAVEPRPDGDRDYERRDGKNMPWRSCYFELGGDEDKVLREHGYEEFPVLVPRWDVVTSPYGVRGPGMMALGDIKQLQHQQTRKAQGIDYQVQPPIAVPRDLKNHENSRLPGGVWYGDPSAIGSIKPLWDVNLRLDYLLADIQDVRERIRRAFFTDVFLLFDRTDVGRMTATEALQRESEKMLLLGPVIEQLHDELLAPLMQKIFSELIRNGAHLPLPAELQGMDLEVEFTSVFAQAQKASGASNLDRFTATVGQLAEWDPEVKDKVDLDTLVDVYGDRLSVDAKVIRGEQGVALIRRARNEAYAAKEQAEVMQQQAGTVRDLASAAQASPDLLNQFTGYGSSPAGV